jgi:hypothetical protein
MLCRSALPLLLQLLPLLAAVEAGWLPCGQL